MHPTVDCYLSCTIHISPLTRSLRGEGKIEVQGSKAPRQGEARFVDCKSKPRAGAGAGAGAVPYDEMVAEDFRMGGGLSICLRGAGRAGRCMV